MTLQESCENTLMIALVVCFLYFFATLNLYLFLIVVASIIVLIVGYLKWGQDE